MEVMEQSLSGQCLKTVERRLETADCRLQTAHWRLRTGVKCRLQTRGKMQTLDSLTESCYRFHHQLRANRKQANESLMK